MIVLISLASALWDARVQQATGQKKIDEEELYSNEKKHRSRNIAWKTSRRKIMVRVMKVINHRGFLDQEIIDTARSKLIERVDR